MSDDFTVPLAAFAEFQRRLTAAVTQPPGDAGPPPWLADVATAWTRELGENAAHWQARWDAHLREHQALWQHHIGHAQPGPAGKSAPDRRYEGAAWEHPYFAYLAAAYRLGRRWIEELARDAPLEGQARERFAFFARQYADALSPAHCLWTNPEALARAFATRGESLAAGLANLRGDAQRGRVSNVDRSAFKVGGNLALTPGAVVYENRLIQVIQYTAATERVYERPLVIVPPCINKYYILDLRPENSFVRHAVANGHTVFVVSWRNPGPELARLTWDDYLEEGVMTALRMARTIAGADTVNALGFCVGGTLLASALAVMQARGERWVGSLTLLTTMLDYSDTGEIGVFIDEAHVAKRERELAAGGLLPGGELALAFASLRANDLVWRYVVNNYLLGQQPEAFDLLFWNDDSANLPGPMYAWYLRHLYLGNRLRVPDALTMCGTPIDLRRLKLPVYAVAAELDHIVPWTTAYASAQLLGGRIEFVLTASGHIAGVVNPPPGTRRRYRAGPPTGADPVAWREGATVVEGSWWPHWMRWLGRRAGPRRAARAVGTADYPALEPAPGRYVTEQPSEQPT